MITKQLVKTYFSKKCPYLIWLMNNEKKVLSTYQKIIEAGIKIEKGSSLENEQNNFDNILDLIKEKKELIPYLENMIKTSELDTATKFIYQMKDLQEISMLSMLYFKIKYNDKIKRADTIDGTLQGEILYDQERIKENTQKYLQDENIKVILEGQIDMEKYRARWDALVKNDDNTYTIYEVKGTTNVFSSKSKIKDEYRLDIMFQYFVYKKYFGNKINNIVLVQLNKDFSFLEGSIYPFDNSKIINLFEEISYINEKTLKDYVEENVEELEILLKEIEKIIDEKEPLRKMKYQCRQNGKCPIFAECLEKEKYNFEDNIFQLTSSSILGGNWKISEHLINEMNCKFIKDIPFSYIEENFPFVKNGQRKVARHQIEVAIDTSKKEYIYKEEIKELLEKDYNCFPLIFFDFETFQYPYPLVKDAHPWEQICSQYSMHIVNKDYDLSKHNYEKGIGGGITHYEFLGNPKNDLSNNPEVDLIMTMLNQFAKEKVKWKEKKFTLVVYNKSFECTQFARMAEKYPKYEKFLKICQERTVDLMDFFTKCLWYKKSFNGKVSLKVVSPSVQADEKIMKFYNNLSFDIKDTLNYHTKEDVIYNGSIALDVYQSLLRACLKGIEVPSYQYIREGLLKYCKKDSWGTVVIYDILKRKAYDIEN